MAGHADILGDSEPEGKRVTRGGGLRRGWGVRVVCGGSLFAGGGDSGIDEGGS